MALRVRHLPVSGYRRTRWKNDGGWTTELAIEPEGVDIGAEFDWRISIAEIESDGPFSRFAGVERDLFLLDGAGIELSIDGDQQRIDQPLQRVHFSGDSAVDCRLIDGATRDFNVMVRARCIVAYIASTEPLDRLDVAGPVGSQWLIHCSSGSAVIVVDGKSISLETSDSLRIDSPEECGEFSISSSGHLLLVRFTPRGSDED